MEPPVEARAEQARPGTSRTFFCILELGKWHQVASRHAGMPTVPGHVRNVYSECILGMYALSGIRYVEPRVWDNYYLISSRRRGGMTDIPLLMSCLVY